MSRNNKSHPNNACVVSTQLDMTTYQLIRDMQIWSGLSMSELLKTIISKATSAYAMQLRDHKKDAVKNVINCHILLDDELLEMINEEV